MILNFQTRSRTNHHRIKGKTGAGPISDAKLQQQQRDRLLKLATETSDVSKVNIID